MNRSANRAERHRFDRREHTVIGRAPQRAGLNESAERVTPPGSEEEP